MAGPGRSLVRSVRRALSTLAARVYLVGCALLLGWAIVASGDGSMAAVIPMFATIPSSLVLLLVLPDSDVAFLLSIVLGALINALLIGWIAGALRRGHRPDPAS
ncbi:SCO4225 family membrane protein [Streptomyces sp. NPDC005576]|uniref:SCO4225 family membrane protein n=1 Tax=unclassified Streptomyces TaxID=2593676 RepID=UPI0033D1FC96